MGTTDSNLKSKHQRAHEVLRELGSVVVAFSGGVDSTLVLKLAIDALDPDRTLAVTGRSPSVPGSELAEAERLASSIGAEHLMIDTDEFGDENYVSNPTNRCYFCKTTLYRQLELIRAERGLHAIVNGTNADDLGDFRPGLRAAEEHKVRSPLAEASLTKQEIRELSAMLGLPTFDKPAGPCLSSRVQYGEAITVEKLRMIEHAEAFLHELGIRECRVRHHDKLARIEVAPRFFTVLVEPPNARRVDDYFRSLGYHYVALDLRGFRSGSMNEVIALGGVRAVL